MATVLASALPVPSMPPVPLPPPPTHSALSPAQHRAIVIGTVAAHLAAAWGVLQIDAVRQAVVEAAPIFVSLVPPPPTPTPPPPPPPQPSPRTPPPKIPLIAAAPTPSTTQPVFVAEPAPPLPPEQPIPAPPAPPAVAAPPAPVPQPRQIPPSAVRYTRLPELNFPVLARRARQAGTVVLRITVDAHGLLKDARVQTSSGFERIDQAALTDIRTARFAPYLEDGKPIEVQTLATLGYDL